MTELKTLKEIALPLTLTDGTIIANCVKIDVKELRQEAIKHAKNLENKNLGVIIFKSQIEENTERRGAIKFIKHFFNLTEDEINATD